MSSRRLAPACALLLAVATGLAASLAGSGAALAQSEPPAERAVSHCNGFEATDEGAPGETVIGTAGDDVIITRGATRVDTGAGNDSICITGRGAVVVNAGPGDDFVGARAHRGKSFVSLGFGDDVFAGGNGNDRVWTQEASNQSSPDDQDTIETGDGDDYVISGSSAAPDIDSVDLGRGDDVLVTYGFGAGASLVGGPGTNTYQPLPGPDVSGDWLFDNTTGIATLDDATRLLWTSFQRFNLTGLHGPRVRFFGSRASEQVVAGGTCRVVLQGSAGNDRLTVDSEGCDSLPAGDARLLGGPGNDLLYGSRGDDVLRGGRGFDRGDGGLGVDTCIVEVETGC